MEDAWRLLQTLPLGFMVVGRDGVVRIVNQHAAVLLGAAVAEIAGQHWSKQMQLCDAETGCSLVDLLGAAGAGDSAATGRHYFLTRPDGTDCVLQISRIGRMPDWPNGWETVLWLRECTLAYKQIRQLRCLCAHDHLTNLVNRREFEHRLSNALERARRDGSRHVLLFMDLDRFKRINDTYGHPAGDAVLKQVAEALRSTVRERDTLGRLGGDEFGLLMEQCDLDEGRRVAEQLQRRLRRQKFYWQEASLSLGISIGCAGINRGSDLETVWKHADAACYRAKRHLVMLA